MNQVLGIRVKASADFSDVTREGAKAAREVREQFSSPGKRIGWVDPLLTGAPAMGGRRDNPQKAVESLTRALDRTHQAGRRLRDIQLPLAQFGEAEKKIKALERRIAMLGMTPFGKDLNQRIAATGTDRARPFQWDWEKMYGSRPAGEGARQRFYQGAFAPAAAARIAAPEGEGGVALLGGVGKLARLVPALAGVAILAEGVKRTARGYQDHLKVIENVDSIYKATASDRGFSGVVEDARALGNALQLTSAEASVLARQFMSASGALDASAFGRAGAAGQFGRGYGQDPSTATGLFARAELVGVGSTRSSQREFARTIAQTIGGSGMFTRSEQVMGDLVGRVESIATSQGRTVGSGELGGFAAILQSLYTNPAMRGGGAGSVLSSVDAMGGRGGLMQEAFAWQSFGDAVGGDAARVRMMQEASAETSPFDLFGEGYTKRTRMELAHEQMLRVADMMPGTTAAERYAFANSEYGNSSMQIGQRQYELAEAMRANGIDYDGFSGWLKGASGRDVDDIEMSGLANLSRMYGKRGDRSEGHVGWMRSQAEQYLAGGNVPSALAGSLRDALDAGGDPDKLETLLPKIMAAADAMGTAADRERSANASLATGFETIASAMHPVNLALKEMAVGAGDVTKSLLGLRDAIDAEKAPKAAEIAAGTAFGVATGANPLDTYAASPSFWNDFSMDAYKLYRRFTGGAKPRPTGAWERFQSYRDDDEGTPLDAVIPPAGGGIAPPKPAGEPKTQIAPPRGSDYPFRAEIQAAAKKHGVPEWALAGIISQESNFGKKMSGDSGASVGFGHFNTGGALADYEMTREELLAKSPAEQIDLAADFLARKKKQAKGDIGRAVELYNGGGDPNYKSNVERRAGEIGLGPRAAPVTQPGPFGKMDPDFAARLQVMRQDAEAAGHSIDVTSGYRTFERQAQLFEQHGRDRSRVAPPGKSAHNFGLAADLKYSSPAASKWARENAGDYGLQFRMDHEPWHVEPKGFHPSEHPFYGKQPPPGWDPSQGAPGIDLSQASPRMPPALYGAIAPNSPGQPTDARWQGQVAMDVTFRTDRGAILQRRHALAVSEPRVAGSGGSAGDSSRFSWNDSVTMPAVG